MKNIYQAAALTGAAALFLSGLCVSCAAAHTSSLSSGSDNANRRDGRSGYVSWVNSVDPRTFDAPAGRNAYGAPKAVNAVPMTFPILGRGYDFSDEFGAPRDGHRHLGEDLFAPKLTPLVAVFDGVVYPWSRGGIAPSNSITLVGDNGYTAKYLHINNDSPGTNDGRGGAEYAFAPGLLSGQRVEAGQFLGWVGNSGNAETTPPHCHFELWGPENLPENPTASLRKAARPTAAKAEIPLSDWKLETGETRWDGLVRAVDTNRGVLVLNLLATTRKNETIAATKPGLTYVRVALTAAIRRDGDGDPVRFSALRPGDHIALRGPAPKSGKTFVADEGALTGFANTIALSGENGAAPPKQEARRDSSNDLGKKISDWWNGVKRRGRL